MKTANMDDLIDEKQIQQFWKLIIFHEKEPKYYSRSKLINKIANMSTDTNIAHGNIDPIIEDLTTAFLEKKHLQCSLKHGNLSHSILYKGENVVYEFTNSWRAGIEVVCVCADARAASLGWRSRTDGHCVPLTLSPIFQEMENHPLY